MASAGFNFTIGARMASSVASTFDTVAARTGKLRKDMRTLNSMSTAAGALQKTQANVQALRLQAAAGSDVAARLKAAETAYSAAQRTAAKYNITVANAAKVHAQANSQIMRTEAALKNQQTIMRNRAKRRELQGEIMGTVASAAMVVAPVKIAIDFESSMADAAKTIDGMRDEAGKLTPEYYKMEAAVKSLGRTLPLTHTELASLFAAGGQMGMTSAAELTEFSTMAAHMAVAFGMGTEEAADAIGGFKTKLGLASDQVREMLDLANQFANTSSATEKDIAGIVSRVGALGDIAGIAYKPMTAMAATLASMKVPEEIAATGLKNFMLALSKGEAVTKRQGEAYDMLGIDPVKLAAQMQVDSEAAMLTVLEKIKAIPKEQQTAILSQLFGTQSVGAIAPMLNQLDLLKSNFAQAADTSKYAGAMQKEFENRARTTENNLTIMRNKMAEIAITAGGALLPSLNSVISGIGSVATAVAGFAEKNPAVVSGVMHVVAALVAFKVASLAGGYGMTLVSDAMVFGRKAWDVAHLACQKSTWAMLRQEAVANAAAAKVKAVAAAEWTMNAVQKTKVVLTDRATYAMLWQQAVASAVTAKTYALAAAQRVGNAASATAAVLTNRATYAMIAQKGVAVAAATGTKLMTVAQWALNAAMHANPISLAVGAVAALGGALYLLYQHCEPVRSAIDGLWAGVMTAAQPVLSLFDTVASKFQVVGSIAKKIGAFFGFGSDDETPAPVQAVAEPMPTAKSMEDRQAEAARAIAPSPAAPAPDKKKKGKGKKKKTAPPPPSELEDPDGETKDDEPGPSLHSRNAKAQTKLKSKAAPPPASASHPAAGTLGQSGAPVTASLPITVNVHGVTDQEFGTRVVDAIKSKGPEIERFLGGLMKDQSRKTYA